MNRQLRRIFLICWCGSALALLLLQPAWGGWTLALPSGYSATRTITATNAGNLPDSSVQSVGTVNKCARYGTTGAMEPASADCGSGVGGAVSTSYIELPLGFISGDAYGANMGGADVLRCAEIISTIGLTTTTTRAVFRVQSGQAGASCSISIYTRDGTSRLWTTGAQPCATGSAWVNVTGLPALTLQAGTPYRYCWASSGSSILFGTSLALGWLSAFWDTSVYGTAANAAPGAVPPTTTGTITPIGGDPVLPKLMLAGS